MGYSTISSIWGPNWRRRPTASRPSSVSGIDRFEVELQPLQAFILPGGAPEAAALHVARAVCRRAERRTVTLGKLTPIRPETVQYLNRLSDVLFVVARYANRLRGIADIPWH